MDDKLIMIEEWKQRYDSYRQYRTNYLTVLSAGTTAALFLLSYVFSARIDRYPKLILLSLVSLISVCLVIAHYIARPNIRRLGDRIELLEKELEMQPFRTTLMLQSALVVSHVYCWLVTIIILALLCEVARGNL